MKNFVKNELLATSKMLSCQVKRGEVYLCNLGPESGSVQRGMRPVIVVQNNIGNEHSPTVIIATLTSINKKRKLPTHVCLTNIEGLDEDSVVACEQLMTIDKCQLLNHICYIDNPIILMKINKALATSVGLSF